MSSPTESRSVKRPSKPYPRFLCALFISCDTPVTGLVDEVKDYGIFGGQPASDAGGKKLSMKNPSSVLQHPHFSTTISSRPPTERARTTLTVRIYCFGRYYHNYTCVALIQHKSRAYC